MKAHYINMYKYLCMFVCMHMCFYSIYSFVYLLGKMEARMTADSNEKRNQTTGQYAHSSMQTKHSTFLRGKVHVSLEILSDTCDDTKTVLIDSSTLAHLWKTKIFKPLSPMNFDCVIGGKVIEIHKVFLAKYSQCTFPLNVIIACGVNDIPVHTSQDTIF